MVFGAVSGSFRSFEGFEGLQLRYRGLSGIAVGFQSHLGAF